MRVIKNLMWLSQAILLCVIITGCEGDGGSDENPAVTNSVVGIIVSDNNDQRIATNITDRTEGESSSSSTSRPKPKTNSVPQVVTPPTPAPAPTPTPSPTPETESKVIISNGATGSVAVSVNGVGAVLSSGSSKTWTYTGSSFSWSYDTGAGYDVSTTVSDGLNHLYNIYDSASVPGTVEARGSSF